MSRKWHLLHAGTKIRIKGENDIEGIITNYFKDNKEIKGYRVKTSNAQLIIVDLDAEIEVIK
jgi:hypothetical protein